MALAMPIKLKSEPAWIAAFFAGISILFVSAPLAPCSTPPPATQESIDSLRQHLAMDYGNPNAHLILARTIRDHGDGLTAFLICEHARRLFGDDSFLSSFDIVFRGHVPDVFFHARKQVLQTAINLAPQSVGPLKELADLYQSHGEPADAVSVLRRALSIAPQDVSLLNALQLNLESAGDTADAQQFLDEWCRAHPDTALAWERHVKEQIDQSVDTASALLNDAINKFPGDGQFYLIRARVEETREPKNAEADYLAAALLSKDSTDAQASAGRFFTKVHPDPSQAEKYYLSAYFLDPDFDDWETVGDRVREAAEEVAAAKFESLKRSGADARPLLADPDPIVAINAMSQLGRLWDDRLAQALLPMTLSDAPDLRDAAIHLICVHAASSASLPLEAMLNNPNPWTRSAAAALISNVEPDKARQLLSPLLSDPATLVRWKASAGLSALSPMPTSRQSEIMTGSHP